MKRFKIFPKVLFYTFGFMLLITAAAHGLLCFLTPRAAVNFRLTPEAADLSVIAKLNVSEYVAQAIQRVLPLSFLLCLTLSAVCSLLFSRGITGPVKQMSATVEKMSRMEKDAACAVRLGDEIGTLAQNINVLYQNLQATIETLELEKRRIREMEQSKIDFLRAASHELKTPVTALNVTLESMLLGVGKYKDYGLYLPECKRIAERLADMIHEILDTSRAELSAGEEAAVPVELSEFLPPLCEPYALIAKARGIPFDLSLENSFSAVLPPRLFGKAVANILANAVTYTKEGQAVSISLEGRGIVIENECVPIPADALPHIFKPFYRPDYARGRDEGGNGLGLYLVDTLLQAIGVSYSFLPIQRPDGMRFTIYL